MSITQQKLFLGFLLMTCVSQVMSHPAASSFETFETQPSYKQKIHQIYKRAADTLPYDSEDMLIRNIIQNAQAQNLLNDEQSLEKLMNILNILQALRSMEVSGPMNNYYYRKSVI